MSDARRHRQRPLRDGAVSVGFGIWADDAVELPRCPRPCGIHVGVPQHHGAEAVGDRLAAGASVDALRRRPSLAAESPKAAIRRGVRHFAFMRFCGVG